LEAGVINLKAMSNHRLFIARLNWFYLIHIAHHHLRPQSVLGNHIWMRKSAPDCVKTQQQVYACTTSDNAGNLVGFSYVLIRKKYLASASLKLPSQ